jgi:uncharacterized sulfatase
MFGLLAAAAAAPPKAPNIIFILADDLGYGDLGCYGQKLIQTPRLDRMADEGMRFTDFYAGAPVCAPARSVLMTGQHAGRTFVRGNGGAAKQTLRPEDITVAEILTDAGYTCGLFGKWGLGEENTTGHPLKKGFESFYGYLNQQHAHNYYPEYLWRNNEKEPLRNVVTHMGSHGGYATKRVDYSHDLVMNEAMAWLKTRGEEPFFLYLALTIPHANNEGTRGTGNGQDVPDLGIYKDRDWSEQNKGQAAMITRMDRDIGSLLDWLEKTDQAENTLVIFTSDNGHHREGGNDPKLFDPNGPLRGMKRDLYDGGIRVPMIAWQPGTVPAGTTSDHIAAFDDVMATACDLSGQETPDGTTSVSFLPELTGQRQDQQAKSHLYWEFYERGSSQAVRFGRWKAVRKPMITGDLELFDLNTDIGETNNLAAKYPSTTAKAARLMDLSHEPNPNWIPPKKNS